MNAQKKISETKPKNRSESPDPIDVYVGGRLRLRRNLLGLSQEQLGKATGLTFQQIQKYERGANRMGASRLHQLSRLLNVSIAYFFEGAPVPAQASNAGFSDNEQAPLEGAPVDVLGQDGEILQRRETLELIRAYYRIQDPKKRRSIYSMIKSMSEE